MPCLGAIRVQKPSSCPTCFLSAASNTGLLKVRMFPLTSLPPPVGISVSVIACSTTRTVVALAWARAGLALLDVTTIAAVASAAAAEIATARGRLRNCNAVPPQVGRNGEIVWELALLVLVARLRQYQAPLCVRELSEADGEAEAMP